MSVADAAANSWIHFAPSLEIGPQRPQDAARIAPMLAAGTPVFVTHLPRHALANSLHVLVALREAGLEPVAHVAARRVESRTEITDFLAAAVRHAGLSRLLLIGGDIAAPAGPYADAEALLADDVIAGSGIRDVAFAAYPEPHPRIADVALDGALARKLAMARRLGLAPRIVTQFCFDPDRIVALATSLALREPDLPVHLGLAGPTSPGSLLKFARVCGVSASIRKLGDAGSGILKLSANGDPSALLAAIGQRASARGVDNIAGFHLFSFGDAVAAAAWIAAGPQRS